VLYICHVITNTRNTSELMGRRWGIGWALYWWRNTKVCICCLFIERSVDFSNFLLGFYRKKAAQRRRVISNTLTPTVPMTSCDFVAWDLEKQHSAQPLGRDSLVFCASERADGIMRLGCRGRLRQCRPLPGIDVLPS